MFSQIKAYIGIAVTAVIGILYALLKIEKSEKKMAEARMEVLKEVSDNNERTINEIEKKNEIKDNVDKLANDDIRKRLLESARDRDEV